MKYVAGHVKLDEAELPIWDDAEMNRFRFEEVSIVPQYAMSALNPTRKVGAVAADLLAARGVAYKDILPELQRRLDLVGLSHDVLGMFPIELSGGMKQRAVMVISTLLDPSLLIADEVTSALDVSSQRALAGMLLEFRERGFVKSMIVVTHDLAVLYQIADTIMVMYAGRLAEKAPAETIVTRPRHPYTKALIGSLPKVGVRLRGRAAQGDPGRPAVAPRPADRLPLPRPLPARARPLRRAAAARRGRARPPRRVLGGRAVLELDRVSKVYKVGTFGGSELPAVRQVSFAIEPGEVVSLIGESGSGKSTIGRMILRLIGDLRRLDQPRRHRRRRPRHEAVLRRRAGRLPGSVQLVQPDLQGRPRVRDDPRGLLLTASPAPRGTTSCTRRSRRSGSTRATCSASTRISSRAASSSAC